MKNKNGFTLIEIIAVIALLGVVLILVTPNVLNSFKKSKESLFLDNVKNIRNAASSSFLIDSTNYSSSQEYCKGQSQNGTLLNITSDNVYYRVTVDYNGEVTSILVSDGEYTYSDTKSAIKKKDIVKEKIQNIATTINCS